MIKSANTQRQNDLAFMEKRIERSNKGRGKTILGGLPFLVGGIDKLVSCSQASGSCQLNNSYSHYNSPSHHTYATTFESKNNLCEYVFIKVI